MPWEKTYDEAEVLEAAMYAFWNHGYQGTSMADLVAVTGINRGSIYTGFGNKRTVFLRALALYDAYRAAHLDQLARDKGPAERISAVFEAVAHADPHVPGGCLMVNTAMERAPHDPEVAAIVQAGMARIEAFFAESLSQCETPPSDIAETARVLQGLLVALLVMTRANRDSPSIPAILAQARRLAG